MLQKSGLDLSTWELDTKAMALEPANSLFVSRLPQNISKVAIGNHISWKLPDIDCSSTE